MGRRAAHPPLRVYQNDRRVGTLTRDTGGAIGFVYHEDWLSQDHAIPVSLSLPLRETAYRGDPVLAVFENLLPDSDILKRRIAEEVGASGTDAYSLLSMIGRDCVGALQFMAGDENPPSSTGTLDGEEIDDDAIANLLKNLGGAPLGLHRNDPFRISVAGAQQKTALLYLGGRWKKPHGTTPTTHLLKTQIGTLPGGIDLSDSVENEFYCLKLVEAFGLPVAKATIETFGDTKALSIERFDRHWTEDGRLLRLPQEDCCQALSVRPTRKYQSDGGPSSEAILDLLRGSDTPLEDREIFFKAQIVFWLIGATDGHAKNFSLFLGPGGSYRMTPLYDILTAQPAFDTGQIGRQQMKLAMSVGDRNHYRFDKILGRHFIQTATGAGLSKKRAMAALEEIADRATGALDAVEANLSPDFSTAIAESVRCAVDFRLSRLAMTAN